MLNDGKSYQSYKVIYCRSRYRAYMRSFRTIPHWRLTIFRKHIIRNIKTIDEALIVESAPLDISKQLKVECMGQF